MKNGIILIALLFSVIGISNAQIHIEFSSSSTPTPGSTFNVDVGVSNFSNMLSTQYWVMWDSTVLAFNNTANVTMDLPGFGGSSISTPLTTITGEDGVVGVSWNDPDLVPPFGEIEDGTILFSIVFDVVGDECDSTALTVNDFDVFQLIEILDADENEIGLTFDALPVKIPGTDCSTDTMEVVCGIINDDADVGMTSETNLCANPGEIICVPWYAQGFADVDGINSITGGMVWDSSFMIFNGVQI